MSASLGKRLVDGLARRPGGVLGRLAYRDGPKAHEPSFTAILDALGSLEGERVLEIGCGPGVLLERVLTGGACSAAGLDHSSDMLALCMARNRQAIAEDRLQLKLGDAATMPWPTESFTAAISANMFFFIYDPAAALAELHRVLAPSGRLVIASLSGPLPPASLCNWWLYPPMGPALNVHTDTQMEAMLTDAGFTDIRVTSDGGGLALQLAQAAKAATARCSG
ncbi:MAG TPA: methyltransferase domain-containing protein [Solirubrobacteraceae bacterium]|nr:methyltransferase domain-containing protein [Solirubrobacteraceae bacterium]